jgi:hypothetical protein
MKAVAGMLAVQEQDRHHIVSANPPIRQSALWRQWACRGAAEFSDPFQ